MLSLYAAMDLCAHAGNICMIQRRQSSHSSMQIEIILDECKHCSGKRECAGACND